MREEEIDKREEREERTSLPFGARRGPIDSGVMSLVLAGVQRDRSGAEGGQRGGGGALGFDSPQQTTAPLQTSEPTPEYTSKPGHPLHG